MIVEYSKHYKYLYYAMPLANFPYFDSFFSLLQSSNCFFHAHVEHQQRKFPFFKGTQRYSRASSPYFLLTIETREVVSLSLFILMINYCRFPLRRKNIVDVAAKSFKNS